MPLFDAFHNCPSYNHIFSIQSLLPLSNLFREIDAVGCGCWAENDSKKTAGSKSSQPVRGDVRSAEFDRCRETNDAEKSIMSQEGAAPGRGRCRDLGSQVQRRYLA
ncbi:hypothetical protein ACFE04_012254 [Oxalis oulophora]